MRLKSFDWIPREIFMNESKSIAPIWQLVRASQRKSYLIPTTGSGKPEIIPGATHLFEEPGTLDIAASLARDWFLIHLPVHSPAG